MMHLQRLGIGLLQIHILWLWFNRPFLYFGLILISLIILKSSLSLWRHRVRLLHPNRLFHLVDVILHPVLMLSFFILEYTIILQLLHYPLIYEKHFKQFQLQDRVINSSQQRFIMLLTLNNENRHQSLLSSLLSINIPILISEAITYPLLKLQSQLLSNTAPITKYSIKYHIHALLRKVQYPKVLQGIRYSIDHSITYSTLRFLLLDQFLQGFERFSISNIPFAVPVLSAVGIATLIAQPSLVQRTVSSSLHMTDYETITTKMKSLDLGKVATTGIKYSLAINLLSTSLDLTYLYLFQKHVHQSLLLQILGGISATILVSAIIHPLHHLRVIEINQTLLQNTINKPMNLVSLFSGATTSILRRGLNNSLLLLMYLGYNFFSYQKKVQSEIMREQMVDEYQKKMSENMRNQMRKARNKGQ